MKKIKVNLKKPSDRSYEILAEEGLLQKIGFLLKKYKHRRYAVIADSNVAAIYGKAILNQIRKAGFDSVLLTFRAGELSKNIKEAEKLLNQLAEHGLTRHDSVIALGGGVTGDLAGFVASTFMRGISLIHIPTSLLAMVDSSIGGKTGINLKYGKNLAGTFYQPEAVFIDPLALKTLPKNEYINGFAEIIKYSVIADKKLFRLLEKHSKKILARNTGIMNNIIIRCASIKASIIEKDETEKGERVILNYGHTVGHAIELFSKYKIEHGEAISMGMAIINKIGYKSGILKINDALRINKLLVSYNLPTSPYQYFKQKDLPEKLWQIMQKDKKMLNSKIHFVIPNSIGKTTINNQVNKENFLKCISSLSKW
jgi:3-dehydroquinate synthase